jgi:hypothetical protein
MVILPNGWELHSWEMSHSPKHFYEITGKLSFRQVVLSANCPFGKMSVRQNVRSAKRPFGKMSFGKMSFGKVSFGKVSFGKMSGYRINFQITSRAEWFLVGVTHRIAMVSCNQNAYLIWKVKAAFCTCVQKRLYKSIY